MRNFDAVAVAIIVVMMLGFSGVRLTPQPLFNQAIRIRQTVFRDQVRQQVGQQILNQIHILQCQNR